MRAGRVITGFGPRRLDERARVRRHARATRQHAHAHWREVRKLIEPTIDRHHRFVRVDSIAVVQRMDGELRPILDAHPQHGNRFVDSTEKARLLARELDGDERRPTIGDQDVPRPHRGGMREVAATE